MPAAPVAIDLRDGKERALRFGAAALADAERVNDYRSLPDLLLQRYGFAVAVSYVWAGLRWENPKLTYDQAATLVDNFLEAGGQLTDLLEPIVEGLIRAKVLKRAGESPPVPPERAAS